MTAYTLNDKKMFADVTDGIAIIINTETGIYYGLNELGSAVYENLAAGAAVETVADALAALEGAPADIKTKLMAFVEEMKGYELLVPGTATDSAVNIQKEVAAKSGFLMTVKEYTDTQELLLADPIHEVKEETGWTPEKDSIGYTKAETLKREEKLEK